MEDIHGELNILMDSQDKKLFILERLYVLTAEQEKLLMEEKFNDESFAETVRRKDLLLKDLSKYDEGFEVLYRKIAPALMEDKKKYQKEVLRLQSSIEAITEKGIALERLEASNRLKMSNVLSGKHGELGRIKISNRTAAAYYKNMSGALANDSYFLDKKK